MGILEDEIARIIAEEGELVTPELGGLPSPLSTRGDTPPATAPLGPPPGEPIYKTRADKPEEQPTSKGSQEWRSEFEDVHGRPPNEIDYRDKEWSEAFTDMTGREPDRDQWEWHYHESRSKGDIPYSDIPEFVSGYKLPEPPKPKTAAELRVTPTIPGVQKPTGAMIRVYTTETGEPGEGGQMLEMPVTQAISEGYITEAEAVSKGFVAKAAVPASVEATGYEATAMATAQKHGIDPVQFANMIRQESGFDPNAVNETSGAEGIAQLMPKYYQDVDRFNPEESLNAAAKTIKENLAYFNGDTQKALAAYNAGKGGVNTAVAAGGENWKEHLLDETKEYLTRINAMPTPEAPAEITTPGLPDKVYIPDPRYPPGTAFIEVKTVKQGYQMTTMAPGTLEPGVEPPEVKPPEFEEAYKAELPWWETLPDIITVGPGEPVGDEERQYNIVATLLDDIPAEEPAPELVVEPPTVGGYFDPTGKFKTEEEYLQDQYYGEATKFRGLEVLGQALAMSHQFATETAETLFGPSLRAGKPVPPEFPRDTAAEYEARWAETPQPFPGVKGLLELPFQAETYLWLSPAGKLAAAPIEWLTGKGVAQAAKAFRPVTKFAELQPLVELLKANLTPDRMRTVANLPVIRTVMKRFGPAAVANTPPEQAVVARAMLRHEGQQKAQGIIARVNALGSQAKVLGSTADDGTIKSGVLKGLHPNDIRTYPSRYAKKLNPEQKKWIEVADDIEREKLAFLQRNGIKIEELSFDEGGQYAGRRVFARASGEGELLETASVGAGPGRPGAKLGAEKHRVFATAKEAVDAGFRYLPEDEALYINVVGAYNRVADKMMSDWLLTKVPWRTTAVPEELNMAAASASKKLGVAKTLRAVIERAGRGEGPPEATMKAIERVYPKEVTALRKALEIKEPQFDKILHTFSKEFWSAAKLTPQRFKEALAMVRLKAGSGLAKRPITGGELNMTLTELNVETRTAANMLGRIYKESHRFATKEKMEAIKQLRVRAKDIFQEQQTIRAAAESARARVREDAMRLKFGEAAVPAPAFTGKILTGPGAQETARVLKASFEPGFSTALDAVNKVNAVGRFLMLAGDVSSLAIQLIFLAGERPHIYAKAAGGIVRAIFDPRFHAKYLARADNAFVVRNSRNLVLTKSGTTEITEAMARGGLLRQGPLKIAGKILEPLQRGYEASLDIAGIEMRKAYDYLCTTPARTAQVEQFINEFRGLTSSARIGVSTTQRQLESAALLAPRYNRAIAALLFDVGRGNLRGSLARRALARGVAAISAMAAAISYARGESFEEIVEHYNPSSPKFFTWDVGGQLVGPGSKVRSVVKLFAQSVSDPDSLLDFSMRNPVLRFVRGNLSPVPSTGLDILTGEDYLGDPTRDGLLSLSKRVLADNLLPIWVQSVALEGGDMGERAIRGLAEFAGMRAYPQAEWSRLYDLRDKLAKEAFGVDYYQLGPELQQLINSNPELKEAQRQTDIESRKKGGVPILNTSYETGDKVQRGLPDPLKRELEAHAATVRPISRTITIKGYAWRMDDDRYQRFQDLIAENINNNIPNIESAEWKAKGFTEKQAALKAVITQAKKDARLAIIKEAEQKDKELISQAQTVAGPPGAPKKPLEAIRGIIDRVRREMEAAWSTVEPPAPVEGAVAPEPNRWAIEPGNPFAMPDVEEEATDKQREVFSQGVTREEFLELLDKRIAKTSKRDMDKYMEIALEFAETGAIDDAWDYVLVRIAGLVCTKDLGLTPEATRVATDRMYPLFRAGKQPIEGMRPPETTKQDKARERDLLDAQKDEFFAKRPKSGEADYEANMNTWTAEGFRRGFMDANSPSARAWDIYNKLVPRGPRGNLWREDSIIKRFLDKGERAILDAITKGADDSFYTNVADRLLYLIRMYPEALGNPYEFDQAGREMDEYMSMDKKTRGEKAARRAYWDAHPLLNKYYGDEAKAVYEQLKGRREIPDPSLSYEDIVLSATGTKSLGVAQPTAGTVILPNKLVQDIKEQLLVASHTNALIPQELIDLAQRLPPGQKELADLILGAAQSAGRVPPPISLTWEGQAAMKAQWMALFPNTPIPSGEQQRLTVKGIYPLSIEGQEYASGVKFEFVEKEPGFAGFAADNAMSDGSGTAKVGNMSPSTLLHEMSHGAYDFFNGHQTAEGEFTQAVEAWVKNPESEYKHLVPLYKSFIDDGNTWHLGATIPQFSGGNINLVPPPLRNWFDWLGGGDATSWDEAEKQWNDATTKQRWLMSDALYSNNPPKSWLSPQKNPGRGVAETDVLSLTRQSWLSDLAYYDLNKDELKARWSKEDPVFWEQYQQHMGELLAKSGYEEWSAKKMAKLANDLRVRSVETSKEPDLLPSWGSILNSIKTIPSQGIAAGVAAPTAAGPTKTSPTPRRYYGGGGGGYTPTPQPTPTPEQPAAPQLRVPQRPTIPGVQPPTAGAPVIGGERKELTMKNVQNGIEDQFGQAAWTQFLGYLEMPVMTNLIRQVLLFVARMFQVPPGATIEQIADQIRSMRGEEAPTKKTTPRTYSDYRKPVRWVSRR